MLVARGRAGVPIVPAMTATVPIPQRVITGTSLVAVLATASVSTVNFAQGGQIDFAAAAVVGAAAMVFAPLGARATAALDGVALKRALATFLLCAAPLVPLKALAFAKRGEARAEKTALLTKRTNRSRSFDALAPARVVTRRDRRVRRLRVRAAGHRRRHDRDASAGVDDAAHASRGSRDIVAGDAPAIRRGARAARADGKRGRENGAALALGCALGGSVGSGLAIDAPEGALETAFFLGMLFLSHRTFKGLAKRKGAVRSSGTK